MAELVFSTLIPITAFGSAHDLRKKVSRQTERFKYCISTLTKCHNDNVMKAKHCKILDLSFRCADKCKLKKVTMNKVGFMPTY